LNKTNHEGGIAVKSINEIKSFVEEQEIFIMPEVRLIGIEGRCKLNAGNKEVLDLWQKFGEINDKYPAVLDSLPRAIPNALLGWTGDCPKGSDTYSYFISVACPSGTTVPDGYSYRDIPASYVAKGEYGDDIGGVINKFTPNGFITCYTDLGWNAELYLDDEEKDPPKNNCSPFRWLVPCVKVDKMKNNMVLNNKV
jgi:predicted transcriptional regulator YdeE